MSKPIIKIVNAETQEVIEREMTVDELAQWNLDKVETEARVQAQTEIMAKKSAAEAKLTALGLTIDDLKALGIG